MFQDIKQTKRSLSEVLPRKDKKAEAAPVVARPKVQRSRKGTIFVVGLAVIVLAAFVVFIISSLFAGAEVVITPKSEPLNFVATQITYAPVESVTLAPISESKALSASGSKLVETKASGQISIFNNFNQSPQKLVKNTRFQAKNGKIYRSQEAVTVPGQKTTNGQTTPGSVTVLVLADQAGDAYNLDQGNLTIPGFAGNPRFEKIYAQIKTPLTGGASGNQPVVTAADRSAAEEALKATLTNETFTLAQNQIPDNFLLYPEALDITFESKLIPSKTSSSTAVLAMTATARAILFEAGKLSELLSNAASSSLATLPHTLTNLSNLKVALAGKATLDPASSKSVTLIVDGTSTAVATVDASQITGALAGQPRETANEVFAKFAGIKSAQATFIPPWLRHFPNTVNVRVLTP